MPKVKVIKQWLRDRVAHRLVLCTASEGQYYEVQVKRHGKWYDLDAPSAVCELALLIERGESG